MVAAVVILYNPRLPLLDRLIRSVVGQVDAVFAIDNTPGLSEESSLLFDSYKGLIVFESLGKNTGIAFAQNIGISKCLTAGASHILLLDQDSELPPNMVKRLLEAESWITQREQRVAAIGPVYVDEKTGECASAVRQRFLRVKKIAINPQSHHPVKTDYVIASGSLIRTSVIEDVGPMLSDLFIDWVDIEWGMRARSRGYESYLVPDIVMKHSVGDRVVTIFGKHTYIHSRERDYYRVRNAAYLLRKKYMGILWRMNTLLRIPKYILLYSAFSTHKLANFRFLCMACYNGARARMGPLS